MNPQELYELKHTRAQKLAEGKALLAKKDFDGHKTIMADVDKYNQEIDAAEKQLAEEGRFDDSDARMKALAFHQQQKEEEEEKSKTLDEIRGGKEYAKSFAAAMKSGIPVKHGWGKEEFAPLYKALAETGGTPAGSDGGFLVPIDFDNHIIRLSKDYLDLSTFFNLEIVNTLSGWRVAETGIPKKLPLIAELGNIGKDDQPKFRQIDYSVKKYGDRVAISNELLDDNVAGLLQYVAEWFTPKFIQTKNGLLLSFLTGLEKSIDLSAGEEDALLRYALITELNTAHSRAATILTNQDGYGAMDNWADTVGRPMLVPNPADPFTYRYRGRSVTYGDNDIIPNEGTKAPVYAGNFKALATLFLRKGIELATTNVGGDAWVSDSSEVRAICRMDAQLVDETAAFKALIPTEPAP